jgi:hypothetical protein
VKSATYRTFVFKKIKILPILKICLSESIYYRQPKKIRKKGKISQSSLTYSAAKSNVYDEMYLYKNSIVKTKIKLYKMFKYKN